MKTIYFVTGNSGKVASLQHILEQYGIKVKQEKIELSEIQADDLESVSVYKAKQAFDILKKPVIVDDSGFFIECLNGFPGVYTKYILDTIGINGLMAIMKNKENRNCGFKSVATFINSQGDIRVFNGPYEEGTLAKDIDNEEREEAWSELWKIWIPQGYNQTLSQMLPQVKKERSVSKESHFSKFAEWISENSEI